MNTMNTSTEAKNKSAQTNFKNQKLVKGIQILSHAVTLIFLGALTWAAYQTVVNKNPLPAWAWLGGMVLFAVTIGLIVAFIVYRGVVRQMGPFDFSPSNRVADELRSETRHLAAGGATSLKAEIRMTMGTLQITGGAQEAFEGDFIYDDADWMPPVVNYEIDTGSQGNLDVEQKATGRPSARQGRCEWTLRLNESIPMQLDIHLGAGKADLKLGGMALDHLRVEGGIGQMDLDLCGEWDRGLTAFLKTGIGDTTLRLPSTIGVCVHTTVGLGSIHSRDLTLDGDAYVNARYGRSKVNLDITIEGGMGRINIL